MSGGPVGMEPDRDDAERELVVYGHGIGGTGDLEVETEDVRACAADLRALATRLRSAATQATYAANALTATAHLTGNGGRALERAWTTAHASTLRADEIDAVADDLMATASGYDDVEAAAEATIWQVRRPPGMLVQLFPWPWIQTVATMAAADAVEHGQLPWAFTRAGAGMFLEETLWALYGIGIPEAAGRVADGVKGIGVTGAASISQVDADGEVVDPGHVPPTQEAIGDVEGMVAAIGELYPDTGTVGEGTIRIDRVEHLGEDPSYLVLVPGTQGELLGSNPLDWSENPAALLGRDTAAMSMVMQAMVAAGIKPGDRVVIGGHSQGGLVAMNVANAVDDVYDVEGVVTVGSPIGLIDVPDGVEVLALEHTEDPTPGLDNVPNEVSDAVTTVERELGESGYGEAASSQDWVDAHDIPNYTDTAALVDASDDGAVLDFLASVDGVLDEDATSTSEYFQGTRR